MLLGGRGLRLGRPDRFGFLIGQRFGRIGLGRMAIGLLGLRRLLRMILEIRFAQRIMAKIALFRRGSRRVFALRLVVAGVLDFGYRRLGAEQRLEGVFLLGQLSPLTRRASSARGSPPSGRD